MPEAIIRFISEYVAEHDDEYQEWERKHEIKKDEDC